jgi:transglutaminase-like putative cysteine protease
MSIRRLGFLLCALVVIALAGPRGVQASEEFDTSLETTYTVGLNGVTTVQHHIKLTNKTPTLFISRYGLKVSSGTISNVTVLSNNNRLNAEVVAARSQTTIGIIFPDKIVGEGKVRDIIIRYQNPDAAIISGQVLEIAVPALGSPEEYSQYRLILKTPAQFGQPSRVSTDQYKSTEENGVVTTLFSNVKNQGISVIFGTSQIFDLTLRYNLENPTSNPGITQIALPPDTAYQRMYYHALDPLPRSIKTDQDGNWIATYQLPAQSTVTVLLNAQAQVSLQPRSNFPVQPPTSELTRIQPYWETSDTTVLQLAAQYTSPSSIFQYVVDTLEYDYDRINQGAERLGAALALSQPERALCQEFTDSFVAIARAAGIPARRIAGYAYTQNSVLRPLSLVQDILHAWPEYYDAEQQQWIQIDPTWQNTTGGNDYFRQFDLNHIAFAIQGESSSLPSPAGSYKTQNLDTKDVEVSFSDRFPDVVPQLQPRLEPMKGLGISIPGQYQLSLTNQTGRAWYGLNWTLTSSDPTITVTPTQHQTSSALLPFQSVSQHITISNPAWFQGKTTTIQLTGYVSDQDTPISLQIDAYAGPRFVAVLFQPVTLLALGGGGILLTLGAGSLLVFRQRR